MSRMNLMSPRDETFTSTQLGNAFRHPATPRRARFTSSQIGLLCWSASRKKIKRADYMEMCEVGRSIDHDREEFV